MIHQALQQVLGSYSFVDGKFEQQGWQLVASRSRSRWQQRQRGKVNHAHIAAKLAQSVQAGG